MNIKLKICVILSLFALVGSSACNADVLSNSCHEFKELQQDKQLSEKLKRGLEDYINNPEIRSQLSEVGRSVFRLDSFNSSFETFISDFEIYNKNLQLVIKSDRADKSFVDPYIILEVGIKYGRTWLLFTNENLKPSDGEAIVPIVLDNNSKVVCD